jgi:acyl-CoA reductase-like NAD-dependent aldehyde dehydrogenase
VPLLEEVADCVGGEWRDTATSNVEQLKIQPIRKCWRSHRCLMVPDVAPAVEAAAKAFPDWRRTPLEERIQSDDYLSG